MNMAKTSILHRSSVEQTQISRDYLLLDPRNLVRRADGTENLCHHQDVDEAGRPNAECRQ